MKNYYSISIPKPCHENWNIMTPKEKGRFCDSCTKTVIDFTKMKSSDIQDFIHENKNNSLCGHFKQTQLDSINLHIPSQVLLKQHSFHKLFLLVLLIAMGTTLMNCTNKNGNKQKIDSVEIIDKENNDVIDVSFGVPSINEIDSIPEKMRITKSEKLNLPNLIIDGELVIETVGKVEMGEIKPSWCPSPVVNYNESIPFNFVEIPSEFKNTPQNLSIKEKRKHFSQQITNIVSENFNTTVCLNLKGRQRINTLFEIDTLGFVKNIRVRAPHPKLEEEAKRVIKLLPQFIPAKQKDKPVNISYTLPIIFQVEE